MVHQRMDGLWGNIWPVGQAVKTPASHAGNGGSIPPRVTRVSTLPLWGSEPGQNTFCPGHQSFPFLSLLCYLGGFLPSLVISLAGGYCTEAPPVPIPNTAVKLSCAEDTWREAAWENRALPALERIVTSSPLFFPLYIPQ